MRDETPLSGRLSSLAAGRRAALAGAVLLAAAGAASANARCAGRIDPGFGQTVDAIAARCGVTPEALRSRNPGLDGERPPAGVRIEVPAPALPSPPVAIGGNRGIAGPSVPQPLVGPRL